MTVVISYGKYPVFHGNIFSFNLKDEWPRFGISGAIYNSWSLRKNLVRRIECYLCALPPPPMP